MRRLYNLQRSLFSQWTDHKIADELKVIDQVLDLHSEFSQWVYEDLSVGARSSAGANGMTAEQVLRAA